MTRIAVDVPEDIAKRLELAAATLTHLDSGEREAIALGLAVGANFVLVDELKGRQAAEGH
jgi:predicted nucleic acid-binding protein